MKKLILSLVVALLTTAMSAQTETEKTMGTNTNFDFNKWSVELSGGLNKPMRPMSAGYRTAVTSVYVADLGVRYMFNNKFGLKQTSDTIALKKVKTQ
jgi:OOP family OmpA-OmpF porin